MNLERETAARQASQTPAAPSAHATQHARPGWSRDRATHEDPDVPAALRTGPSPLLHPAAPERGSLRGGTPISVSSTRPSTVAAEEPRASAGSRVSLRRFQYRAADGSPEAHGGPQ